MALNYRKRVKVAPGVYINISKSGVSTTVGVRGASVNFGKNGAYVNTGIPGTGFYQRNRVGEVLPGASQKTPPTDQTTGKIGCFLVFAGLAVFSFAVLGGTFGKIAGFLFSLGAILVLIFSLFDGKQNANAGKAMGQEPDYLQNAKTALENCSDPVKQRILRNFIACYELADQIDDEEKILEDLGKSPEKNKALIEQHQKDLEGLKERIASEGYDVDAELSETERAGYENLCRTFEVLAGSERVWRIVTQEQNTRAKSSATTVVTREQGEVQVGVFNYLKSNYDVPVFVLKPQRLYLYPKFALLVTSPSDFEVVAYDSLRIDAGLSRFHETDARPSDAQVLGYTYKYVNKNGGPDRRFSDNPQIPVLGYGEVIIRCSAGKSVFQFSNYKAAKDFGDAFAKYRRMAGHSDSRNSEDTIQPLMDAAKGQPSSQYAMLNQAAANLFQCLQDMDKDEAVADALNRYEQLKDFDSLPQSALSNRLAYVAYGDVAKCYDGLGHSGMDSEEALGLAAITLRMMLPEGELWKDEALMRSKGLQLASRFYDTYKKSVSFSFDPDKFLLLEILKAENVDENTANRYAVLLYRFAMAIAQADDQISSKEKAWLANILKSTGQDDAPALAATRKSSRKTAARSVSPGNAMKELDQLIGLGNVKAEVTNIYNLVKIQKMREQKGMRASSISYHCVFTGNPGTGKTTVARLLAQIYKELGILKKGHLVETDRSGLVAEYVGQTAAKTNKIIDSALDGVLFIDEAYALAKGGNDYGMEAISTLLKRMEDDRDRLVVVLAGYSDEMERFIHANPGLQSRFNRYIHFEDYGADDLAAIFEYNLKKFDYQLAGGAKEKLMKVLEEAVSKKDENFGNARYVRNLFEKTLERQARRLASVPDLTEQDLMEITEEDI